MEKNEQDKKWIMDSNQFKNLQGYDRNYDTSGLDMQARGAAWRYSVDNGGTWFSKFWTIRITNDGAILDVRITFMGEEREIFVRL